MTRPSHLCLRPLLLEDISQVVELEHVGFPPHERASPLRIEYRLTNCPELCSGLFIRKFDENKISKNELPDHSTVISETLIGHVIGTKMLSDKITNNSMEVPNDFISIMCNKDGSLMDKYKSERLIQLENEEKEKIEKNGNTEEELTSTTTTAAVNDDDDDDDESKDSKQFGHFDNGNTIGIHSVIIDPNYRGLKLATLLLKDYLQKMSQQYVADSIALICKEKLIPFYADIGFSDNGISKCKFAGEEWHDMTIHLDHEDDED